MLAPCFAGGWKNNSFKVICFFSSVKWQLFNNFSSLFSPHPAMKAEVYEEVPQSSPIKLKIKNQEIPATRFVCANRWTKCDVSKNVIIISYKCISECFCFSFADLMLLTTVYRLPRL